MKSLLSNLNLSGLNQNQVSFLTEYFRNKENNSRNRKSVEFVLDFLLNPNKFRPTDFALCSAYVHFVLRRIDRKNLFSDEINTSDIDWKRMRNVKVYVTYSYSSTLGAETAAVMVEAEVKR